MAGCSLVRSAPPPPLQPLTKQLRAAARSGKGKFLLMTFKEVFDNITAGERGSVGTCCCVICLVRWWGMVWADSRRASHAALAVSSVRSLPDTTHACLPRCPSDAFALREAYNDASYFKDEGVRAFKLGVLSLEERAQVCGRGGRCWHAGKVP